MAQAPRAMTTCPHCDTKIILRKLPHPGFFTDYRICPNCDGQFTQDRNTKRWQAICLPIALTSLVWTILLYFQGTTWLLPALASYAVLGVIIYWRNGLVYLVPYSAEQTRNGNDQ